MVGDYFQDDPGNNFKRMLAAELLISGDPEISARQQRAFRLAGTYASGCLEDMNAAQAVIRDLIGSPGDDAHIRPPIFVDCGSNTAIGEGSFVSYSLTALEVAPISIGKKCQIGPNVQLLTPTHPVDPQLRMDKLEAAKPIAIHDSVWLGGGTMVLPGVTTGENTVVSVGAVMSRDLPPYVVAVGVPAEVTRTVWS
ncbi:MULTISPECIES: sugar O-acetyltransferase [Arthrobacter]|uniref:Sugar O-acetyltransferase n=1 Tax=Arthrobacter terricola TaxID=2547396 RepID=A0A4R5K8J7_9MICC|nr:MULTISPECIES: sugar O-acetyltransferase [Arthrobacter]MBT8163142.1 sugar O-acetyltransferase [Arthrobacter sp. GN70]TDF91286.1 sugar O-acetyltransferase [Arthrobacter terricola]